MRGEHVCGDGGADGGPRGFADGGPGRLFDAAVVVLVGHLEPAAELVALVGVDPELGAQPGGLHSLRMLSALCDESGDDLVLVGVNARPEQRLHLRFGDFRPRRDGPWVVAGGGGQAARFTQCSQPATHPAPGGLALGGVVVTQCTAAAGGVVSGGDLPDEIHVPVAGGEFVKAHHRGVTTGCPVECPVEMQRRSTRTLTTPAAVSDNVDQRKDPHRCAGLVKVAPVFLSIFLANLNPRNRSIQPSIPFRDPKCTRCEGD